MKFFIFLLLILGCNTVEKKDKIGFSSWTIEKIEGRASLWYPTAESEEAVEVQGGLFLQAPKAVDAAVKKGRYPLIVISTEQDPTSLVWLAEQLVTRGYIVCSIQHHFRESNFWRAPEEITALLDSLFRSSLGSSIDSERIGMVGYSLGGLTAVWLAGAQRADMQPEDLLPPEGYTSKAEQEAIGLSLRQVEIEGWRKSYFDPRIKAYILLAPSFSWVFHPDSFQKVFKNMLIFVGEADLGRESAIDYAQDIPQASFLELQRGVGHWEFTGNWSEEGIEKMKPSMPVDSWPSLALEHRRGFTHKVVIEKTVQFFKENI